MMNFAIHKIANFCRQNGMQVYNIISLNLKPSSTVYTHQFVQRSFAENIPKDKKQPRKHSQQKPKEDISERKPDSKKRKPIRQLGKGELPKEVIRSLKYIGEKIDEVEAPVESHEGAVKPIAISARESGKFGPTSDLVEEPKIFPSAIKAHKEEGLSPNLDDPKSLGMIPYNSELDTKLYTKHPDSVYHDYVRDKTSETTKKFIEKERKYVCGNFDPLPVVLEKGDGCYVKDIDGHIYLDFLSAFSAVNHGHHNRILMDKAISQMNRLYITSRAVYHNQLGEAAKTICETFGYEKILFTNTGVEAGESAVKIARKWGYDVKKIPENQAKIVFAKGNFWGRTIYACGSSDDPIRYQKFGPFDTKSLYMVEYNNFDALKKLIESDTTICAVFLEPIQGEGGVKIPKKGYLKEVNTLCKNRNVLLIADEIQTGMGRAGHLLYCHSENVKPDLVLLGKSLGGGIYPVSAVLGNSAVIDLIQHDEYSSTFGGNPLGVSIAITAIKELIEKDIIQNGAQRGIELGICLKELANNPIVKEIRGRGLMYGIELWPECGINAYDLCLWLMERGLLCKPAKKNILRLSPPLIITTQQIERAADIIIGVLNKAANISQVKSQKKASFNIPSSEGSKFEKFKHSRTAKKRKEHVPH